jgi:hypothetical protein
VSCRLETGQKNVTRKYRRRANDGARRRLHHDRRDPKLTPFFSPFAGGKLIQKPEKP